MPSAAMAQENRHPQNPWARRLWPFAGMALRRGAAEPLQRLRQAMLQCLGAPGRAARPLLATRIAHATDAQTLWYLRSELMLILADLRGEEQALREMAWINTLFEGLIPAPMTSRPMPLR